MPLNMQKISILETDVFIIGGGLAGCNAAIAAAEKGATVIIADKGKIERSGDIGGGVDHFMAFLNEGGDWDTREEYLRYVWRIGKGTADIAIIDKLYCEELPEAINRMARIGNPLTQPDGNFYRTKSMGQPGPYFINFNGKKLKPCLAAEVRRLKCTVLDKTMTTDLITREGRVVGATAFNIRSGEFYVIIAGAVVIATGNTNRLYESPRINPFNTWLCPFDTGDGQAMAFRAGAALSNMEYMRMTMMPKGFASPGFNAFTGMGARFMNANGEYYMEMNHPLGNRAPRYDIVFYSLKEVKEGRGPLFIDCTGLSEDDVEHLEKTLGYDKDTLPDYMKQRGEDIRKKQIEITVSEGMQAGPTEVTGSGIKVNADSASTVPGLFACGDASDSNRCVHGAVTGGYAAGKSAFEYAANAVRYTVSNKEAEAAWEKTFAPLKREEGMSFREFENIVRKIMTENVGVERNEKSLFTAIEKLKRAGSYADTLKAGDLHELMRVHESRSLLQVGEITAHAALFRKESRNKPYHYRLDYPDTDDTKWCGQVVVQNSGEGNIKAKFQPITFLIPDNEQRGNENASAF